jgi:succinate dehydrogenase/fumarate reductase flavoprotein subunit
MSLNNEHAKRLREIAAYACWVSPEYDEALLAGAKAMERQERDLDAIKAADAALTEAMETISDLRGSLEVAKAALEQIINNRIGDVGRCGSRHCDCSECVAVAALARLEGK